MASNEKLPSWPYCTSRMKNQRYESTPNRSISSNGWIPVAFVFDIFLPPTVRKPCAQTCIGGSTSAAINIAGQ